MDWKLINTPCAQPDPELSFWEKRQFWHDQYMAEARLLRTHKNPHSDKMAEICENAAMWQLKKPTEADLKHLEEVRSFYSTDREARIGHREH